MNHKDKKTTNMWLRDLKEKQYINWIYSNHFLEKTKPAIYYLGINGIRHLKTKDEYPLEELRKRYREYERSKGFIDRSILVAQCPLDTRLKNSLAVIYYCCTEAEYIHPAHSFHFLHEHEAIRPNLCIVKQEHIKQSKQSPKDEEPTRTNFLLEIIDDTLPKYRVRKRIQDYVDYLINDDWDSSNNDPPPIILLVMPTLIDLIYAKRRTKKLLLNEYYETEDIPKNMHLRFTTVDQLKEQGVAANIWEERRALYDV